MVIQLAPKIQQRLGVSDESISTFCYQWGITNLALFGSILRDDYRDESDIDVLITFAPNARQGLLTLAKIKNELEYLLNRPVDVVLKDSVEASENWIRRREILATAQTIYEQG